MAPSTDICCVVWAKVVESVVHSAGMKPKFIGKGRLEHDLQADREIEHASSICFSALGEYNYRSSGELRILNLLKG